MNDAKSINLNLADPESIKAALPKAEQVLRQKAAHMLSAQRDYRTWNELVDQLKAVAGVEDEEPGATIIQTRSRPMSAAEMSRYTEQVRQAPSQVKHAKRTVDAAQKVMRHDGEHRDSIGRAMRSASGVNVGRAVRDSQAAFETARQAVTSLDEMKKSIEMASSASDSPVQDSVVRIVEEKGGPARPREVAALLERQGANIKSVNAINSALYAAAKSGRIIRPAKGQYAPKGWTEEFEDATFERELLITDEETKA